MKFLYDLGIDFVLPFIIIIGCFGLLFNGIDGEVKSILTLASGWVFHSGVKRNIKPKPCGEGDSGQV